MKKLNQTIVISSAVLVLTLVGIVQFMLRSETLVTRPSPSPRLAKTRMVLPLSSMREDQGQVEKQKSLVESVEAKIEEGHSSLVEMRPNDKTIRSEVARDPHHVPSSLLDFSVVVAEKMNQAKKSLVYAEALFSEFQQCAISQGEDEFQNLALRAYCLANAKRLVSWFPDLSRAWSELSEQVDHQLLDLMDLAQQG